MKRKLISVLLCVALLLGLTIPALAEGAEEQAPAEIVTITVNYVYAKDQSMVARPWTATIEKGSAFQQEIILPKVASYQVDEMASNLPAGVSITAGEGNDQYLAFAQERVTEDLAVTLLYQAEERSYTVVHWQQNIADDAYTKIEQVELTGSIDAYTEATQKLYEGFTCKGIHQTVIAATGEIEVDIYYGRNHSLLVFNPNGGINGPEPIYDRYGATYDEASIPAPTRAGYNFDGWQAEDGSQPDGVVRDNVTYQAQWTPASPNANVTVVYWGENANDDEYSYIKSTAISAGVGVELSGGSDGVLICGKQAHTHGADCWDCGKVEHMQHDAACYGLTHATTLSQNVRNYFQNQYGGVYTDGTIYVYNGRWNTDYYIYFGGSWYEVDSSWGNDNKITTKAPICGLEIHDHGGTGCAYVCGLEEHEHSADCYLLVTNQMDSSKWVYDHSDTVVVDANGTTVLNMYYTRKPYTITFIDNGNTIKGVTEKWGADITSIWPIVGNNGTTYDKGERWSPSGSSIYEYVLVYIAQMPAENFTLTANRANYDDYVMNYYQEVLPGGTGVSYSGKTFTKAFTVESKYNYVTMAEDFFPLEGFSTWKSNPTAGKDNTIDINGGGTVNFYYTRNSDSLEYFNGGNTAENTKMVPYQANLGDYGYTPVTPPITMEADAVFVGWYQNPQCTGEQYGLDTHTMPPNNMALYAKWENQSYTVRTYTDESLDQLYTYEGYDGTQSVVKYTTGTAPVNPTNEGFVFVGWFYEDGGTEKAFDFSMPVTKDYQLYPKWSDRVNVNYVVHYYIKGTTTKLAEDQTRSVLIGTTASEVALRGDALIYANGVTYYPETTSINQRITTDGAEIIFYYTAPENLTYTVNYYLEGTTEEVFPSKTVETNSSVVTEFYQAVEGYSPLRYSIQKELSTNPEENVLTFYYTLDAMDLTIQKAGHVKSSESFLFRVQGEDGTVYTVAVQGQGSVTLMGLPVQTYTVTEESSWSWSYQTLANQTASNTATLTFTNVQEDNSWLSGDAAAVNTFHALPGNGT